MTTQSYPVAAPVSEPVRRSGPPGEAKYRRTLFHFLLFGGLAACGFLFFSRPDAVPAENALLAIVVILLGLAPAAIYLTRPDPEPMPALSLIGIFYLVCFAIPVFSAERVDFPMLRPEIVKPSSLAAVILGILLFFLGYAVAKGMLFRRIEPLRLPTGFDDAWLRGMLWILLTAHLAALWLPALRQLPSVSSLTEPAGYVAYGMFFLLWVHGRLPRFSAFVVGCLCVPAEVIAHFASGALLPVVMFGVFCQIVYWYHARKVPWRLILLVAAFFIPLQPVKDEFRRYTWYHGRYANASPIDKAQLFAETAWRYYTEPRPAATGPFYRSAAGRLAHIRFLAFVMRQSPNPVPYWGGETYKPLLTKMIPRFLWPDKPREMISHEVGHRYSMINETDHVTAVNMPWLVELWINFGPAGLVLGMLLYGAMFGYLVQKLNRREMTALEFVVGATILFPLAVNQESHFSVVAGNSALLYLSLYFFFHIGYLLQPRRRRALAGAPAGRGASAMPYSPHTLTSVVRAEER